MAYVKTIKDNNGNIIYPQTSTSAVYNAEGKSLDSLLSENNGGSSNSEDDAAIGSLVFKQGIFEDTNYLPCEGQILDIANFPEITDILPRNWSDPLTYSTTLATSCTKLFYAYDKLWTCGTVAKDSTTNPLYYSEDYGKTWLTADLSSLTNTATHNLVYSNGCMILTPTASFTIQASSTCFYSLDGITWNEFAIDGTSWTDQTSDTTYARACYGYFNGVIFFRLRPETTSSCYGVYYNIETKTCGSSFQYPIVSGIYPLYDNPKTAIFLVYQNSDDNRIVYQMYGQGWAKRASGAVYGLLVLDGKCVAYPSGRSATGTTIGNFIYESSRVFLSRADFLNNTNAISISGNPNNYCKLNNGDYCSVNTTTFSCYSPVRYKMPTASTSIAPELQEYLKISTTGGYKNPWKVYKNEFIPALSEGDMDANGFCKKDDITITYTVGENLPTNALTDSWKSFDHDFATGYDYYGTSATTAEIIIDLGREIELGKFIIYYSSLNGCDAGSASITVASSKDGVTYNNIYSLSSPDALATIVIGGVIQVKDLSSTFPLLLSSNVIRYIKITGKQTDKSYSNGIYLADFNILEWAEKEENI